MTKVLKKFLDGLKKDKQGFHNKIVTKPEEYAMFAYVKAKDSARHYFHSIDWAITQANKLCDDNRIRHVLENQFSISAPLSTFLQGSGPLTSIISTFLLLNTCFMVGLAYVVVRSLITNQISEREYDNAMLRTLGWNKSHIVCQLCIKMLVMFVVPGFIIGITLSVLTTYGVRYLLNQIARTTIIFEFGVVGVWVGLIVAVVLPVLAGIRPVMQSLTI